MIPNSKNTFLEGFLASLRKRAKPLKHKVSRLQCDRILERGVDSELEKIEVELESKIVDERRLTKLFVWEDKWIWVWTGSMKKRSWIWEHKFEGRLLGNYSGRDVVSELEKTHAMASITDGEIFLRSWQKLLANGPKLVSR